MHSGFSLPFQLSSSSSSPTKTLVRFLLFYTTITVWKYHKRRLQNLNRGQGGLNPIPLGSSSSLKSEWFPQRTSQALRCRQLWKKETENVFLSWSLQRLVLCTDKNQHFPKFSWVCFPMAEDAGQHCLWSSQGQTDDGLSPSTCGSGPPL